MYIEIRVRGCGLRPSVLKQDPVAAQRIWMSKRLTASSETLCCTDKVMTSAIQIQYDFQASLKTGKTRLEI
jgi:hypothetical protein